jgi:hypothetical protein
MISEMQIADWILGVAVNDLGKHAGQVVYLQDYFLPIAKSGVGGHAFQCGLKYANDQHWVTLAKGNEITITEAGYR